MNVSGVELPISEPGEAAKYVRDRNKKDAPGGNVTHTVTAPPVAEPIVETPPAAEVVETKTEPTETPADLWIDPETGDEIPGKPSRYQRRLSKLWEKGESERQMREAAEKRARDLEAQLATRDAAPRTPAAADTADTDKTLTMAAQARIRPKPDRAAIGSGLQYPSYEDYVEDCAIWGGELAAEKRAIKSESMQVQTAHDRARTTFAQERETAKADYPDFDQVTNQDLKLNQAIADAVIHAPAGLKGHVQYWLGKHPDETARIASLSHEAALIEMGMVIATVKAERAAKAAPPTSQPKTKPQSDAPPPPEPLRASTAKDTPPHKVASPGDSKISPVDWIKSRNAEVGTGKARVRI